jgi:hypothetical protein
MAAAAGVIGGLAYLTRSAGLPLLISCPLFFAIRKQYRRAALFVCAMLPAVAAWAWWANRHTLHANDLISLYYTNYLGFHLSNFGLKDLPVLVSRNAAGMVTGAGDLIAVLRPGTISVILGLAALGGAVRMVRRIGLSPYLLYAGGLILMLLPWHLCVGDRYMRMLFPVLPLLEAGLYDLLRDAAVAGRRWYDADSVLRMAGACVAAFAIASVALLTAAGALRTFLAVPESLAKERRNLAADREAFRWAEANLAPKATFLTGADPVLYLYTGRKACTLILLPREVYFGGPDQPTDLGLRLAAYARAHRLDYVFLNAGDPGADDVAAIAAAVRRCPELKPVYPTEAIFSVGRSGATKRE